MRRHRSLSIVHICSLRALYRLLSPKVARLRLSILYAVTELVSPQVYEGDWDLQPFHFITKLWPTTFE